MLLIVYLELSIILEGAWKKHREQSLVVCKAGQGARKRRVSFEYISGPREGSILKEHLKIRKGRGDWWRKG